MATKNEPSIELVWMSPQKLKPYKNNSKFHSQEQVAMIAHQIREFGFDQPIVVRKDMTIIKGHGRREAALQLKLDKVPVIVTSIDENKAMASRIGDNKVAEAPWINDALRTEFTQLKDLGLEFAQLTGFNSKEFQSILDGWSTAPASMSDDDKRDQGLTSRITVTCLQVNKDRIVQLLTTALKTSGLTDAKIL